MSADREAALREALESEWYHSIELAPGKVTRGAVDLRAVAPKVLPPDLSGQRALDVGTFDGFWAFELEKRGAEDVLAADLDDHSQTDWPPPNRERLLRQIEESGEVPHQRFLLAHRALDSRVRRVVTSIYDLDVERLGGPVNFALVGALLLHLRDPVRGLEAVRSVLAPGGTLLLVEPIVLALTLLSPRKPAAVLRAARTEFDWWVPNTAGLRDYLHLAGFKDIRRTRTFRLRGGHRNVRQWHAAYEARP